MKRALACLVASALILTCPGFAAYAAAGEMAASAASAGKAQTIPILSLPKGLTVPATISVPQAPGLETQPAASVSAEAQVSASAEAAPVAAAPIGAERALETGAAQIGQAKGDSGKQGVLNKLFTDERAAAEAFDEVNGPAGLQAAGQGSGLTPSSGLQTRSDWRPPTPPGGSGASGGAPQGPRGSKVLGFITTVARMAGAAGAVIGLQHIAPLAFGLTPMAGVWAVVASGLLPLGALYTRLLLSRHDSVRLRKVKWVMDAAIGAFAGAAWLAKPLFGLVASAHFAFATPLLIAAGVGTTLCVAGGGALLDTLLAGGIMIGLTRALPAASHGPIGVASVLAMMAVPVMTNIVFFGKRIADSAEGGRAFSLPGSLQAIRFPVFHWLMTGVVFALLTGYAPVHANLAFFAWMLLGNASPVKGKKDGQKPAGAVARVLSRVLNFDVLYLGLLAFTAATGFTSPWTFLAIAFAPERADAWMQRLLARLLPEGPQAPSSFEKPMPDPASFAERLERRAPRYHHFFKTGLFLVSMLGFGWGLGAFFFGIHSLLKNLAFGGLMAALPYFMSDKLVIAMMKGKPADPKANPEVFAIRKDLIGRINAKRGAKGQKPIPEAPIFEIPMDAPNAFATGRDPFHAVIGVTKGIKDMLLIPENLQQNLVTLMTSADPASKSFRIFRRGIAASVPGVTERSTPAEISQALMRAQPEQLKALGVRLLRGVLGHEFSHVMDRHMLTGAMVGAVSTAVSFMSYGALWTMTHAKAAVSAQLRRLMGRPAQPQGPEGSASELVGPNGEASGAKPQAFEPVTAAILAGKGWPVIATKLVALWSSTVAMLIQMAASRNNEEQADEDGAYLTQDPEALALALGLLMTWKPKQGVLFSFSNPGLRPYVGAAVNQQLFTVNPVDQLSGRLTAREAGVFSRRDDPRLDWLFKRFVTHPDTVWRIETLEDISSGMRRDRSPR